MPETTIAPLTRDLLAWIDESPRTYADTMEAWKTHCPRLSVWEDALLAGLIAVRKGRVLLTNRGIQALSEPQG